MFTPIGNSRPMLMNTKEYINFTTKKILDNQPIDNIRSLGR